MARMNGFMNLAKTFGLSSLSKGQVLGVFSRNKLRDNCGKCMGLWIIQCWQFEKWKDLQYPKEEKMSFWTGPVAVIFYRKGQVWDTLVYLRAAGQAEGKEKMCKYPMVSQSPKIPLEICLFLRILDCNLIKQSAVSLDGYVCICISIHIQRETDNTLCLDLYLYL